MPAPLPAGLEALAARGGLWRGVGSARLKTESSGIPALDARLPGGGWPAGALSELLPEAVGIGEIQLVLPLLARLSRNDRQIAWVAPPHIPYAPALANAGVALARMLVVDPPNADETIWTAEQLLRTPAYAAVLVWAPRLREADSRRLQLAAESSGSIGLVYRPARAIGSPSVAALRLSLACRENRLQIEILKSRGGQVGSRFFSDEPAEMSADEPTYQSPRQAGAA